jgi:hypothetical protein
VKEWEEGWWMLRGRRKYRRGAVIYPRVWDVLRLCFPLVT